MKIHPITLVTLLLLGMTLSLTSCNLNSDGQCNTEQPEPTPEPEPEPEPEPTPEPTEPLYQVSGITMIPADTYGMGDDTYFGLFEGVTYVNLTTNFSQFDPSNPADQEAMQKAMLETFFFPIAKQSKSVQFYVSPASEAAAFTMENYNKGVVKLLTSEVFLPTKSGATEPIFTLSDMKLIDAQTRFWGGGGV